MSIILTEEQRAMTVGHIADAHAKLSSAVIAALNEFQTNTGLIVTIEVSQGEDYKSISFPISFPKE